MGELVIECELKMASILIIEDEKLLATALKMALCSVGHEIMEICDTGEEAVLVAQRRAPNY